MRYRKECIVSPFLFIAIAVSVSLLGIGLNQIGIAQPSQSQNLASTEKQHLLEGISFQIGNVTFTHHTATVNGIQLHYVMGGKGDPLVLLHGYPQSWYEWRYVMPSLAKFYTVVAPDLRGFGDSSKPLTGYDGKTTSEDIYQLTKLLGFNKIFLAAHDVGSQTAFSYTAGHPNNVTKLIIMDFFFPGFFSPALGQNGPWWFSFYQQQDIPEMLIQGHEREFISSFMRGLAYNPSAIKEEDIDVWTSHAVSPGGLRGSFEHFRAFPTDAEQNKETAKSKIITPVLALGGDIYPAFGGDVPNNLVSSSLQPLASNVTSITVPLSGHWIPEEQPQFVIDELLKFFGTK